MTLTVRKLECVSVLAQQGHFARAAERLGLSQPALSRTIALLEADYGIRLFDRGGGIVRPTAAGAALLADAERLVASARSLDRSLRDQASGESGTVRLGFGPLPAALLLDTVLADTVHRRPRVVIEIAVDHAARLLTRLNEGSLDACVIADALLPGDPGHAVRPIGTVPLGLYVRARHPLLNGAPGALAGAAAVPAAALECFPLASGHAGGPLFEWLRPTIACDDFPALERLMLASDTVILSGAPLVAPLLASGAVRALTLLDRPELLHARLVVVRIAGRAQGPAQAEAIALVAAAMGAREGAGGPMP